MDGCRKRGFLVSRHEFDPQNITPHLAAGRARLRQAVSALGLDSLDLVTMRNGFNKKFKVRVRARPRLAQETMQDSVEGVHLNPDRLHGEFHTQMDLVFLLGSKRELTDRAWKSE